LKAWYFQGLNMSEHDSTTSSNSKFSINPYDYFVPLIVTVVLCILVVATFHEKEPDRQLAGLADRVQALKSPSDATAATTINLRVSDVVDAPGKTVNPTATADQLTPDDQTAAARHADGADTADTDVMSPAQRQTSTSIDRAAANLARNTVSTGKPATDQYISESDDTDGTGSGSRAPSADKDQAYTPMQDQRHRHYLDAWMAQQAHRMKMLEYRAEVMKRIEQDRRDLYRYRHNTEHQRHEHRDRYRQRLEQARNGAGDIPI
jgi:hypothetical protein